jgi:phosphatidate cytidylyltransferase
LKARIAVAAVAVPALVIVLYVCPAWATALLMCAVSAVSARELVCAAGLGGETFAIWPVVFAALTSLGAYMGAIDGGALITAMLLALSAIAFTRAAALYGTQWHKSAGQIFCVVFAGAAMPWLLSSITRLRVLEGGRVYALFPFVSAFVTDAGAYFAGMFFGRHPAFPAVSPKKTVEGCVGGAVFGIAGVLLYGLLAARFMGVSVPFWALALTGALGSLATQLGDLAFSYIKREYKIKDFGAILPGHGGMLDRFDSMVFAAPAVYLVLSAARGIV